LKTFGFDRTVKALFAELVVPLVSSENASTGVRELTFSASGRHDRYNDVGNTTNPKFGLTYKPFDSFKLRTAWGKSFVAPSLANRAEADPANVLYVPRSAVSFLSPPASLIAPNGPYPAPTAAQSNSLIILGSAPGLKPQSAKTFSIGFDFDPPFVAGLNLSGTYWAIEYNDVIALPDFTNQVNFWKNLGQYITVNPSSAQLQAFHNIAGNTVSPCSGAPTNPGCVYAILDARKTNLGQFKISGADFAINYNRETGFGSLDFGVSGSYILNREQSAAAGAPLIDELAYNRSHFRASARAGAQIGNLRAQAILNHTHGYRQNPPVGLSLQNHVSSFDVVNLFFKYDFKHDGFMKDMSATLNIDNALDRDPPSFDLNDIVPTRDGYTNGWTLGRVVLLGVSKKF
jgi:iron complex outermembrane receptor protein